MINPDDFIINRKRKKYKFAKFANSPICFELEEWKKTTADIVELGAGNGLFSIELASRYPQKQFVAVDVKADRLQKGAYEATDQGLTNIKFVRARADQLDQLFINHSVSQIWITFPDPYPRTRSARRRMTHLHYLEQYKSVLKLSGSLLLKHDNREFFCWSLEQLVAGVWSINELSFDLHESDMLDDYKIMTSYEKRWIAEGLKTNFVRASI